MANKVVVLLGFQIVFSVACIFGWSRCVYQLCTSDFSPIGKREIVYGIGTFTGLGIIIGYCNISDK